MMKQKKYSVYQVVLAYLFGRYQVYREERFFDHISFQDFLRMVLMADERGDSIG